MHGMEGPKRTQGHLPVARSTHYHIVPARTGPESEVPAMLTLLLSRRVT
jgi:hypothetical protein